MPPKDTKPELYFYSTDDGRTYEPIGPINDIQEFIAPPDDTTKCLTPMINFPEMDFTVTLTGKFSRYKLLLVMGLTRFIPNNWLKMHGYPMRRKHRLDAHGCRTRRRRKQK